MFSKGQGTDLSTCAVFSKGKGNRFVDRCSVLQGPREPMTRRADLSTGAVFSKGQVSPAGRGGTDLSTGAMLFKGQGTDLSTGAMFSKGQGGP